MNQYEGFRKDESRRQASNGQEQEQDYLCVSIVMISKENNKATIYLT